MVAMGEKLYGMKGWHSTHACSILATLTERDFKCTLVTWQQPYKDHLTNFMFIMFDRTYGINQYEF